MDKRIEELVHIYYWERDINCARTTLLSLSDIFQIPIVPQTMNAAIGLHGAGGYGAQCGLAEGALMFLGIYFSEKQKSDDEIADICFRFASGFTEEFGSLSCRKLRSNGIQKGCAPHLCERITRDAIYFCYEFINDQNIRNGDDTTTNEENK